MVIFCVKLNDASRLLHAQVIPMGVDGWKFSFIDRIDKIAAKLNKTLWGDALSSNFFGF